MKFIHLLLFTIAPSFLFSQSVFFGVQIGRGTYKMDELKSFNEIVKNNLPFNNKITHSYPSFFYYQPEIMFTIKKLNLGFLYSFHSTGSRISSIDYSGEYRFDSKIKSDSYGFICDYPLYRQRNWFPGFTIFNKLGVLKTTLEIFEYFRVFDTVVTKESYFFYANNYYFEPGFSTYYTYGVLLFKVSLSYSKQFGANVLKNSDNITLKIGFNDVVKPEWDGLRCGLSVFLALTSK